MHLNCLAPRPAWLKYDGWRGRAQDAVTQACVQTWLHRMPPCHLNWSFHLSKPRTPQLQSRERLLNFFLSIKLYGGSVTWAGGLLPDAVATPWNPLESREVLPIPSANPHLYPEAARGLWSLGQCSVLSLAILPPLPAFDCELGLFSGVPGINLTA